MKKLTMAVACLMVTIFPALKVNAQLENVAISSDSSLRITSIYAGMLATTSYVMDKNKEATANSFRVGGAASWQMSKKLQLKSWAIADYGMQSGVSNLDLTSIQAFWFQWQPSSKWQMQLGKTGTLAAQQHRPLPASSEGQFETWTQSQFPGVAPTATVKYMPNKNTMFGLGISTRNEKPEYHATATFGRLQVSAFYQESVKAYGAGFSYKSKDGGFTSTGIWKQNQVVSSIIIVALNKKQTLFVYNDIGYSSLKQDLVRWETGILRVFTIKPVRGLLGIGRQYETQAINAYLYLTL